MKKIFTLVFTAAVFMITFAAAELEAQDSDLGLTVGLDYVSNYMSRGEYVFGNPYAKGGYFFPYASFDVFNTGLTLQIRGEIGEAWIGGSSEEKELSKNMEEMHSLDFNADFVYSVKEIITFDVGAWYYRHKQGGLANHSYFDFYVSAALDAVPLTPTVSLTYSYFVEAAAYRGDSIGDSDTVVRGDGKNEDFYLQFGLGHGFELTTATYLDLAAVVGFSRNRAIQRKSDDISDIDLSAGISTTKGIVTLMSAFHYVIIPGTQFKYYEIDDEKIKDIHRFYVKFGASVSI